MEDAQEPSPVFDDDPQRHRFQVELEFVQSLANPWYLNYLAQQQYFHDSRFVAYLKYLEYWRKPEYAQFITYPHCLHLLELLQSPSFREQLGKREVASFIHQRQYYHWQYWRNDPVTSEA